MIPNNDHLITALYKWICSNNGNPLLKDTTRISSVKYDAYVNSTLSDPLSFTVFELSDKGELMINSRQKLLESKAAFFLFVNPKTGWIFAIKNTTENQKKIIQNQPIQNFKIKIVD